MLYRVIQTKLLQEPVLAQCGGGVGRLMANAILNFHFDFPHTSLRLSRCGCEGKQEKEEEEEKGRVLVARQQVADSQSRNPVARQSQTIPDPKRWKTGSVTILGGSLSITRLFQMTAQEPV